MKKIFVILFILIALAVVLAVAIGRTAEISNSFYEQFITSGGPVVWFLLLPMSFIAIYLSFELMMTVTRAKIAPSKVISEISELIKNSSNQQWLIEVNKKTDFVSCAVLRVMQQTHIPRNEIARLLSENIQQQAMSVLRKIEWLNIIGSIAPMIGLFGTVFGMIKAFNGIVAAGGQPQPAHLAGGISLALVTTFWGLLVAIPALAIAGIFRNRLEGLTAEAISESDALVTVLQQSVKNEKNYIRKLAFNRQAILAEE